LFPRPEYFLYPNRRSAKRGLYPEELVRLLEDLADSGQLGRRLDWDFQDRFSDKVWAAYERAMEPFQGATAQLVEDS